MASKKIVKRAKDNLSKDFLAAVGLVAVEWSFLEAALQHAIATLAKIDNYTGLLITASADVTKWTESLRKLSNHYKHPKAKEIEKLCETIVKTLTKRNRVVHALWLDVFSNKIYGGTSPWPEEIQKLVFSMIAPRRGKKSLVASVSSVEEIEKIAAEINDLRHQLKALIGGDAST